MIINDKQLSAKVQYAANRVPVLDGKVAHLEEEVVSVLHYKGTKQKYSQLPTSGNKTGDVWNIVEADPSHDIDAGDNVAWNGSSWDVLGGITDLSAYLTTESEGKDVIIAKDANDEGGTLHVAGLIKSDFEIDVEDEYGLTCLNSDSLEVRTTAAGESPARILLEGGNGEAQIDLTTMSISTSGVGAANNSITRLMEDSSSDPVLWASEKDTANGVAGLDANNKVLSDKLPVDGHTIIESNGVIKAITNRSFNSTWKTNGTMRQFVDSIAADTDAVPGMSYLGDLTCSDLPTGIGNAEAKVEIINSTVAPGKAIHIILSSGNVAPYHWERTYWGTNLASDSGWIGFQPELPSKTGNAGKFLMTDGSTISWQDANESKIKYYHATQYVADPDILNETPLPIIDDLTEPGLYHIDFTFDQAPLSINMEYFAFISKYDMDGEAVGLIQSLISGIPSLITAYRMATPDGEGGYVWTDWQGMLPTDEIYSLQSSKQDRLTAGQNITIQNNTISAATMECHWFHIDEEHISTLTSPVALAGKSYIRVCRNGKMLRPFAVGDDYGDYGTNTLNNQIIFRDYLEVGDNISLEVM